MKQEQTGKQIAPGVLKFKRYKYATDYMEQNSLTNHKVFENPGNGFLLYKNHSDLRNALNQAGQRFQLAKAIGLQFASNIMALVEEKIIKPKVKAKKKPVKKSPNGFPESGVLFTPNKGRKLEFKKVGSFYFYIIYDCSNEKTYANGTTRYWYKKRAELKKIELKMRTANFINYLYKMGYICDKNFLTKKP